MAIRITDTEMVLTIDEIVVAATRTSQRAAANGNGAGIASTHPACLFSYNPGDHRPEPRRAPSRRLRRHPPVRVHLAQGAISVTDRLISLTIATEVVAVAIVAAIIPYQHAYELVTTHGEIGIG